MGEEEVPGLGYGQEQAAEPQEDGPEVLAEVERVEVPEEEDEAEDILVEIGIESDDSVFKSRKTTRRKVE